jgi:hypothetical protein
MLVCVCVSGGTLLSATSASVCPLAQLTAHHPSPNQPTTPTHPPTHTHAHTPPLQVRLGVLEREKAELTDEVDAARTQLAATDAASARDFATKAEGYRQQLTRANSEITTLLRDKATVREGLQRQQGAEGCAGAGSRAWQQGMWRERGQVRGREGRVDAGCTRCRAATLWHTRQTCNAPPHTHTHTSTNTTKLQTLEQLLSLRREVDALRAAQEEAAQAAELASDEAAGVCVCVCVCVCVRVSPAVCAAAAARCAACAAQVLACVHTDAVTARATASRAQRSRRVLPTHHPQA